MVFHFRYLDQCNDLSIRLTLIFSNLRYKSFVKSYVFYLFSSVIHFAPHDILVDYHITFLEASGSNICCIYFQGHIIQFAFLIALLLDLWKKIELFQLIYPNKGIYYTHIEILLWKHLPPILCPPLIQFFPLLNFYALHIISWILNRWFMIFLGSFLVIKNFYWFFIDNYYWFFW